MVTITFTYKTKAEQFKEQFPELYAEIYDIGYRDALNVSNPEPDYDHYEEESDYDHGDSGPFQDFPTDYPEVAVAEDDSPRYCKVGKWHEIYEKAVALVIDGYKAGNRDWEKFMKRYEDWRWDMFIAWNPTHKQFVVESDIGVIDELYPHLVGAVAEN